MTKDFAVMFMNKKTGHLGCDVFTSQTESAARHDFSECYRHAEYIVLAVVEMPAVR